MFSNERKTQSSMSWRVCLRVQSKLILFGSVDDVYS